MKLELTIEGVPATQRPRIKRGGRGLFNVPAVKAWKKKITDAAFFAMLEAGNDQFPIPAGVPVRLDMNAYLPWAKGTPKYKAYTIGDHTQKPDISNILKHLEDALSDAGVWTDDAQIDTMTAQKFRCPRGEEYVAVKISW